MPTVTATFLDSGNEPIASGVLRVQLNAPLIDPTTNPDGYLVTLPHDFAVTNGVLIDCQLKESESDQVSYTFTLFQNFTDYDYYYAGSGEFYARNDERPSHLHTDSKYYTGVTQSTESVALERIARPRLEPVGDAFQAIVPNVSSIDFSQLERTGFATDRTPQTARQVASVLRTDPLFMQGLIDFLVVQPYSNTQLYRRGNIVEVGGSSYQCLIDNTVGFPPPSSPTQWRLLAAKGDPGGTGGNDAVYSAAWNGDLNAPSKNALYDYLTASIALKSELAAKANLASPVFTGSPTRDANPAAGNRSGELATTQWVGSEFATIASPTLTGTPATTTPVSLTENTTRIPSTAWVQSLLTDQFNRSGTAKGYFKATNGLYIQWGQATNGTGAGTETFAIAFPTQCVAVNLTLVVNDTAHRFCHVQTVSNTQFTFYRAAAGGPTASASPVYYIAIGF